MLTGALPIYIQKYRQPELKYESEPCLKQKKPIFGNVSQNKNAHIYIYISKYLYIYISIYLYIYISIFHLSISLSINQSIAVLIFK